METREALEASFSSVGQMHPAPNYYKRSYHALRGKAVAILKAIIEKG